MDYEIAPSACFVLFGIRYLTAGKVDDDDPRIVNARKHGLSVWSGRRYPPPEPGEPAYFLLIGKYFSRVGYDGSCEISVPLRGLRQAMKTTTKKLAEAGFTEAPELWLQCKYD